MTDDRPDATDGPAAPADGPAPEGRRRGPRRAVRGGTRPGTDESPDLAESDGEPAADDDERDRWLREQRPPHWE